jgi:hypothetical protein
MKIWKSDNFDSVVFYYYFMNYSMLAARIISRTNYVGDFTIFTCKLEDSMILPNLNRIKN